MTVDLLRKDTGSEPRDSGRPAAASAALDSAVAPDTEAVARWAELEPVANWMVAAPVEHLRRKTPLSEAALQLDRLGASDLPVLDGQGRLIGVLTAADLYVAGRSTNRKGSACRRVWPEGQTVGSLVQARVPVIRPDTCLGECARRMVRRSLHHLYVLVDGALTGVISARAMMLALARLEVSEPVQSLATTRIEVVEPRLPMSAAVARLDADAGLTLVVTGDTSSAGVLGHAELVTSREAEPDSAVEASMERAVLWSEAGTTVHAAAAQAYERRSRYVVVHTDGRPSALVSALDFAGRIGRRPSI